MIIAIAACKNWKLYHLDVKSAFLNDPLQEKVYITQPPGFVQKGEENKVYIVHEALYGLKQAPRAWYSKIDTFFLSQGFKRSMNDPTLYIRASNEGKGIISLYVDDILITGDNVDQIQKYKEHPLR